MTESTKRAVIYCRVSTEDQEREGTSLDTQLEACRKLAIDRGYQVINEYREARSGLKLQRDELDLLREQVRNKQIDVVVIYSLDRLTRDPNDGVILTQEFEKNNVTLVAVTEDIDNSELGQLINYIKGYAANLEAKKIVDRTSRGRRAKAQKPSDNYAGGFVPFGYTTEKYLDGDRFKNRIIIDPVQAETVKQVFSMYNGGMTTSQIARHLYEQHVPTKRKNGTWTGSLVWRMLRNRTYIGKGNHADVESPRPAIIDEVTFTQVQARLDKNTHRSGRPNKVMYLLKGLGRCSCGGTLAMRQVGNIKYAYCSRQHTAPHKYRCFTGKKHNHLEPIESFVWGECVEFLTEFRKGDLAGVLYDNYEANIAHRDMIISEAKSQLEEVSKMKDRLLSDFVDGRFAREKVDLKLGQLTEQEEHWQRKIDEQLALSNVNLDGLIESLRQLDNLYDWGLMTATPEQRREIISRVLHEFILYPDRIELRYKLPVTEAQVAECVQASRRLPEN